MYNKKKNEQIPKFVILISTFYIHVSNHPFSFSYMKGGEFWNTFTRIWKLTASLRHTK